MSRGRALLLAGAALVAPAASAAEEPEAHPGDAGAVSRSVGVNDRTVVPLDLVVAPGSRVVWTNVGIKRHTVTDDLGTFDSGTLLPGETFAIVAPATVGRLEYHCRFHRFIRGSLTVSLVDLRGPEAVAYGRKATLTGSIPDPMSGAQVVIERRAGGGWTKLLTVPVDMSGRFSARTPGLRANTLLRARLGDDLSPTAAVAARTVVRVRRVGRSIEARVAPARAGLEVRLERLDIDRYVWRPVGSARLDGRGRARLTARGAGVYRVHLPHGVPGVDGGISPTVPLRG